MKHIFRKYKLELVQEKSNKYEVDRQLNSVGNTYKVLRDIVGLGREAEEVLILLTLDTKLNLNGIFEVSRGNISSSIVHPREVLKRAILNNASSIIIAHNHPSGNPDPSKEDLNITARIEESCKIIGINLLDHFILGDKDRFVSFKEKGLL